MPSSANGARRRSAAKPPSDRRALVLAGGGITGLAYEIGALRALDDLLVGNTVNDFDLYVGTSAGSLAAALLANGVTPTEMALVLAGTDDRIIPPTRWTIYRPNVGEAARNLLKLPELIREMAWELVRHPSRLNPLDIIGMLSPLLPSGLFTCAELQRYLQRLFAVDGLTDQFAELHRELLIVSCAIDSSERVVFSRDSDPPIPISSAVAASGAIPILFKPVRIDGVDYVDGGIKGISAIDLAVDRGASLIVVINPVVPIDTRGMNTPDTMRGQIGQHLRDGGIRAVYNQVMRGMLHDGMLDHIRLVRNRRPDVDILLIEPRADDDKMFFHELMSFSARLMVMQHGYESVSNGLHDTWGYLRRILPRHGVHITRRVIDRKPMAPAKSVESASILLRVLRQTVLARRPRLHVVKDSDAA